MESKSKLNFVILANSLRKAGRHLKSVDEPKMEKSYVTGFLLRPARRPAVPLADSYSLLPLPAVGMKKVRNFVAGLARTSKSADEIKIITDDAFKDKTLMNTVIYNIYKS